MRSFLQTVKIRNDGTPRSWTSEVMEEREENDHTP